MFICDGEKANIHCVFSLFVLAMDSIKCTRRTALVQHERKKTIATTQDTTTSSNAGEKDDVLTNIPKKENDEEVDDASCHERCPEKVSSWRKDAWEDIS